MTGGGAEFDVCIVERMHFREEEASEQIGFGILFGGGLRHDP